MFKYNAVPDVLQIGIIVPILKKSSNDYNNFRPITLSTVHAKLVELIILPMVNLDIGGNQYGYQAGKGTEFCCALVVGFGVCQRQIYAVTYLALTDSKWPVGYPIEMTSEDSLLK